MSIINIQNLSYQHPDREVLFEKLDMHMAEGLKTALIGKNGVGKTTLFRLICQDLNINEGSIFTKSKPYYIPQHLDRYNSYTVVEALGVADKLKALHSILAGNATYLNFELLNDDWEIEDKIKSALAYWNLSDIDFNTQLKQLSGGEKTKVFLSGIQLHNAELILLDEPSNHLDYNSREILYDWIGETSASLLIISHDRYLLNLLTDIYELTTFGINHYTGNYSAYEEQKEQELDSLSRQLKQQSKELTAAKKLQQETVARQQKLDAKGKNNSKQKGIPKILLGRRKNSAENSTSKLKSVHEDKSEKIIEKMEQIKSQIEDEKILKLGFKSSDLHKSKILVEAKELNFSYDKENVWHESISFCIRSGDRTLLKGLNGSGKSTLLKLIIGELAPTKGSLEIADFNFLYLDQEYSLIDDTKTVYEQAQSYNSKMPEHEVKRNLVRSQFTADMWNKTCDMLSGGEKMKLSLCSLMVSDKTTDMLILDEPTNNIDLDSSKTLLLSLNSYSGSILLVSHDKSFSEELSIDSEINLDLYSFCREIL